MTLVDNMADCRYPGVEVADSIVPPRYPTLVVTMEWPGNRRPVLTGDKSEFVLVVKNTSKGHNAAGQLKIGAQLESPYRTFLVDTPRTVDFAVGAGQTTRVPVPEEWLFVEGKFAYALRGAVVNGAGHPGMYEPLASMTIFERSTFHSQRRTDLTTLLIAAVAAIASVVGALRLFGLL